MALVYFDASALVKLVVDEEGSELAASLWDGCDAALASRLADVEVCAALAAAGRNHDLSARALRSAQRSWNELWAAVRPVELTAAVQERARGLATDHGLRGADAVHLASALTVDRSKLVVAAWDQRLRAAAIEAGCAVAPAVDPVR